MRCVQFVLLCCLVSAVLCHPGPEADQKRQEKSEEDVGAGGLQTWMQQQASTNDRLQAELTAYKNQVDSRLDSYNNRLDSCYQADSCRNQRDNKGGSLKKQVGSLKKQVGSLKSQVDSYKSQMDFMDTQLQMLLHKGGDGASRSVAFTARISGSLDSGGNGLSLDHEQTVIFGDVVTNIGNAYDNSTGVFTTPVNGTYVFFLNQMVSNTQGDVYLAIVKNGAVLDVIFSGGSTETQDLYDQGSSLVSVVLADGDQVWVRQWRGNAVRAGFWTIFTGFLLHAE